MTWDMQENRFRVERVGISSKTHMKGEFIDFGAGRAIFRDRYVASGTQAGTILLFDEYLGFPDWKNGEFRAWQEFAEARGLRFRYLGFGPTQAALQVL